MPPRRQSLQRIIAKNPRDACFRRRYVGRMISQKDKALRFRALHEAPGCFVIPNPWDIG